MKSELPIPFGFYSNILKIVDIFSKTENKPRSARDIAITLNLEGNYIYQTTKTMELLSLLENHARQYTLTEDGKLFSEHLQKNDKEKIRELGKKIIFNVDNKKTEAFRKAFNIIKMNQNLTDFDIGSYIAKEYNLVWKANGTYQRVGGSCRSVLEGLGILEVGEQIKLKNIVQVVKISHTDSISIIANLHKEINTYIHLVSEDSNAWKNYIDIRQKIERYFDELIKKQNMIPTQLLLQESKKWFIEGVNKKDVDLIRHSLRPLINIERNNILK